MTYPIRSVPDNDTAWGGDVRAVIAGVNDHQTRVTALEISVLHRVVYSGGAYAARPSGVAAGFVDYVGPTQPTTWLTGDTWTQTS